VHRHELSDEQWALIEPLIPPPQGRRSIRGNRDFVNAVLWIARTGAPWRDLPERFGKWKTVFNRFANWSKRGVWRRVFKELQLQTGGDVDLSILDASIVRAHQDAAGGKGGSKSMLSVVLGVGSPRRSTPSSTRTTAQSRSRSPPVSDTKPPSPRTSSPTLREMPASETALTTPHESARRSKSKP
jgi:transposase